MGEKGARSGKWLKNCCERMIGRERGARDETALYGQHHAVGALSGVRYRSVV